ncbi:hypothetical protein N440_3220 [Stenotrophomonas sp. CC22-02]|nr:hypothetical protein N440_3220 [Stenotrophomonas sp. CC22-02]
MRISRGIFRGPLAAVKRGVSAGLRPAPAEATSTSTSTSKAGYPWDGGVGAVEGGAASTSMYARSPHPCGSRPLNRTHPAFDRFSRPAVDPRHAWMLFVQLSKYSISMEIHLQRSGNLSEVGRCRSAGCPRHGCRGQAPRDGFTASPHSDTAPPSHGKPLRLWPLRWPLQVQGATLPNPYFTQPSISPRANGPSFALTIRPCASNSTL